MECPTYASIRMKKKIDQANIPNPKRIAVLPLFPTDSFWNIEKRERLRNYVIQRTQATQIAFRAMILLVLPGTDSADLCCLTHRWNMLRNIRIGKAIYLWVIPAAMNGAIAGHDLQSCFGNILSRDKRKCCQ